MWICIVFSCVCLCLCVLDITFESPELGISFWRCKYILTISRSDLNTKVKYFLLTRHLPLTQISFGTSYEQSVPSITSSLTFITSCVSASSHVNLHFSASARTAKLLHNESHTDMALFKIIHIYWGISHLSWFPLEPNSFLWQQFLYQEAMHIARL